MHVLVLTNMYPPHHYGGYEINCAEAVSHFRRSGHEVVVLTSDVTVPGVSTTADDDPDVRRELKLYWANHVMLEPSRRESLRIERHNQQQLERALDDHHPDVVSVWHMGAMSMGLLTTCRRRGVPLVHVVNDDWLTYGPGVDRWWNSWASARGGRLLELILKVPCRRSDLGSNGSFCFVSETTRRRAETAGWTFPLATIGYCGINLDDFPVAQHPPRSGWSGRLLSVGRIDERKGIDTAIRALPLLPDTTRLDVIGRGDESYLAALHRLADHEGVSERVVFDVRPRDELSATYAAADAFLFLPTWEEPFGLVPLEAMACSTPVIATATGGSGEFLVHERNCLQVPVGDAEAVADAVHRLAADPELRARLVTNGHTTAAELTLPRWLGLLHAWHQAAASEFPTGPPLDRERIADVLAAHFNAPTV